MRDDDPCDIALAYCSETITAYLILKRATK